MGDELHVEVTAGAADQPRILLVEPKRIYAGVIARRLGQLGFRIATARTAHEGLAEIHRIPVDLVLSEIRLPGTDGVDLVRMIRGDAAHCHLPLLLIAGRSDRKASVRAFEAGVDGVVLKPFAFEVLAARMVREIERARALQELRRDNATLDARVISRAIELGEMRARWECAEAERLRLEQIAGRAA